MSFRDDLKTILSGGLPALIDGGSSGPQTSTPVLRVEEIPPSGTINDREPFLMRVTSTQILIGTAAIIGALALLMIARR